MNKATKFRWVIVVMMFLINFLSYMDRVNLSVATPFIMNEFSFTKMDMGFLQTMFFLGYALMQIPGGILGEYFGPRKVISLGVLWWSFFTGLTAVANSLMSFAAIRFLFGMGEGPIPPTLNTAVYRWFSKSEKATAYSTALGGAFIGPVFGPAIVVAIMMAFGWRAVFISFGVAGAVLALGWYYLVKDSPRQSPFVNQAEIDHIEAGMEIVEEKKEMAPWKSFMASSQFWAIGLQYFITDYIMFVFLAWLPMYLMEAQGFSLQKMGFAAAFPWAALCAVVIATGFLSDKLISMGLSKHKARTVFGAVGLICCSVFLYLGAVATTPWMNVLWLTLSLGSLGFTFSASWAAATDIGGRFTGSVSGWMNFWGNIGGVLAPLVTAWIATHFGWQAAILLTAASAVVGIIAWIFVKPDVPLVLKTGVEGEQKAL
ncbi:MAG: major facilitator superfamily 1 [Firmicutes bacterium]|nr:major facilitator superfamily 1 [Bacillota bacterium]